MGMSDPQMSPISAGASGTERTVCEDIARRQALGLAKYGISVAENPLALRQWLQHAYEETLDQAIYLRRAIDQIDAEVHGIDQVAQISAAQQHASDCSLHNAPAYPPGPCDCGTPASHEDARRSFGGSRYCGPRLLSRMQPAAGAMQHACSAIVGIVTACFSAIRRSAQYSAFALRPSSFVCRAAITIALAVACSCAALGSPSPVGGPAAVSPLLAEAVDTLPDPHSFGAVGWLFVGIVGFVGIAGMVLAAINGFLSLRAKIRGEEPHRLEMPIETRESIRYATHEEMRQLRRDHEALAVQVGVHYEKLMQEGHGREERVRTAIKEVDAAGERRAVDLHNRINVVAEMKAIVQLIASRLNINLGGNS